MPKAKFMYNEETMKIGINSRVYQNSKTGIPYYLECLYKKILEIDKKNQYVFFQTNDEKKIGITKTIQTFNNPIGTFLFDNFLVNKLIDQEKIDIFHGPANLLPFFRKKGVKHVVTIHDLAFLIPPQTHTDSKFYNWYYKSVVARSLKNADFIIAVSRSTKTDIKKFYHLSDDKIKVIHQGVNDIYFKKIRGKRLIKDKYFFSLTTHLERKNTMSVLRLMAKNRELLKYEFVIAGLIPDCQLNRLREKIKELKLEKNVILFGYASEEELVSLYQNAEFFIHPSFYEGFGFPVLEAMACKCPVITSNTSSLKEITPDKEWLVDPYNLEDINDKVVRILNLSAKKRESLIQKNYNFAKKFTWEKTAKAMIKIFNNR